MAAPPTALPSSEKKPEVRNGVCGDSMEEGKLAPAVVSPPGGAARESKFPPFPPQGPLPAVPMEPMAVAMDTAPSAEKVLPIPYVQDVRPHLPSTFNCGGDPFLASFWRIPYLYSSILGQAIAERSKDSRQALTELATLLAVLVVHIRSCKVWIEWPYQVLYQLGVSLLDLEEHFVVPAAARKPVTQYWLVRAAGKLDGKMSIMGLTASGP